MDQPDDLAHWLRLVLTEGVGPQTARELLARFGLPGEILAAGFPALQKCVHDKIAHALCTDASETMQAQIDATIAWAALPGNHVLTLADPTYPQALLTIPDPPPLLYAKGRLELLALPAMAIVGSRNATAQGMQNAEQFARTLSLSGICVISGLALGIDAAAHQGACSAEAGNGSTIAVTGTGLDLVYPGRHRALAHRIAEQGCLISEYPLGTPAIASNFPRRNRLISGLSVGVLVVEAALQSGSLTTARSALEQGREVFAIPGSIHSPLAKGCHRLIRDGAKLVESAQDIMEELHGHRLALAARLQKSARTTTAPSATPAAALILRAAGHDPASVDALAERTGLKISDVQAALLQLELERQVERLADGRYQKYMDIAP
jgi:DNA processing protein